MLRLTACPRGPLSFLLSRRPRSQPCGLRSTIGDQIVEKSGALSSTIYANHLLLAVSRWFSMEGILDIPDGAPGHSPCGRAAWVGQVSLASSALAHFSPRARPL